MIKRIRKIFAKTDKQSPQDSDTAVSVEVEPPAPQLPSIAFQVTATVASMKESIAAERKRREQQFMDELATQSKAIVAALLVLVTNNEDDPNRSTVSARTNKDNSVVLMWARTNKITALALNSGVRDELAAQNILHDGILIRQVDGKTAIQFRPKSTTTDIPNDR